MLIAFIFGIGAANFLTIPGIYLVAAIVLLTIFFCFTRQIVFIVTVCCLLGILRFQVDQIYFNKNKISDYNNQTITFTAIVQEPDIRIDHVKLTIKTLTPARGNVLVRTTLYPKYDYGDLIEVKGKLQAPEPIEDFQYDKYLARYNIYSTCYSPKITPLENNQGNYIFSKLLKLKNIIQTTINRTIGEPHAAFLSGVLIGARQGIPADLLAGFNRTGVTHIIAISGYNITIIATMLMNLCLSCNINRKKAFKLLVIGILMFVILVGGSAAVIRAAVMGIIVSIAKQLGRQTRTANILALTAAIMLLINPKILIYDAGFQLSFLATLGLIYLSPKIEPYLQWVPKRFALQENLTSTMSAIIMTTPLILHQFNRFSVVAPIVNLLILPFIPLSMLTGFIQVIAGLLYLPLGKIIGYSSYFILEYIIRVVSFFSNLGFASIEMSVSLPVMVVMYVVLGLIIINKNAHVARNKRN